MGRRTLSTLPTYRDLLKPELPDPLIVYAEISCCKEASKTQYDKTWNMDLPPLPLGSPAYAKPRPSQRGGGGLGSMVRSLDTGNLVLRRNRTQLRPAAHSWHNLQPPPGLPITQPSFLGPSTTSRDLQEDDQPPAATFTQTECQPSQPPTMPKQQGTEVHAVSPEAAVSPSTT